MKLSILILFIILGVGNGQDLFDTLKEKDPSPHFLKLIKSKLDEDKWIVIQSKMQIQITGKFDVYRWQFLGQEVQPNESDPSYESYMAEWRKEHRSKFTITIDFRKPLAEKELKKRLDLKAKLCHDLAHKANSKIKYREIYKGLWDNELPTYQSRAYGTYDVYMKSPFNDLSKGLSPSDKVFDCVFAEATIKAIFKTSGYGETRYCPASVKTGQMSFSP